MRSKIFYITGLFMLLLAPSLFAQIKGPENVFVAEPVRTLSYEVLNSSSETKSFEIKVYCPAELRCEIVDTQSAVAAGQKAIFKVAFMPSDNSISNRYSITLLGKLGDEILEKKIDVAVGIPKLQQQIEQPKEPASEAQESNVPVSFAVAQQTAILNILLAIIALLLFAMLMVKIRDVKR